jgi:flagellar basal body-associated protein FliL
MAKAEKNALDATKDAAPAKSGIKAWLIMGTIGLISGATGFAVPMVFLNGSRASAGKGSHGSESSDKADHDSPKHDSSKPASAKREPGINQPTFVPFGEVVVNLAEEKMTRYLRINLTLQVDSVHEETVKKALEKKKTILKNWLIGYLSDKELDEVRGAIGVNKARREIQDQFNRLLFPDGTELIQDILFEDFTVT